MGFEPIAGVYAGIQHALPGVSPPCHGVMPPLHLYATAFAASRAALRAAFSAFSAWMTSFGRFTDPLVRAMLLTLWSERLPIVDRKVLILCLRLLVNYSALDARAL